MLIKLKMFGFLDEVMGIFDRGGGVASKGSKLFLKETREGMISDRIYIIWVLIIWLVKFCGYSTIELMDHIGSKIVFFRYIVGNCMGSRLVKPKFTKP